MSFRCFVLWCLVDAILSDSVTVMTFPQAWGSQVLLLLNNKISCFITIINITTCHHHHLHHLSSSLSSLSSLLASSIVIISITCHHQLSSSQSSPSSSPIITMMIMIIIIITLKYNFPTYPLYNSIYVSCCRGQDLLLRQRLLHQHCCAPQGQRPCTARVLPYGQRLVGCHQCPLPQWSEYGGHRNLGRPSHRLVYPAVRNSAGL